MIQFDDRGLLAAIVQDADSGRILMHAYMNEEALKRTLEGPDAWFYSRSRQELWHKGETSGNFLKVTEVQQDCDGDAIVVKVNPVGPACHTGAETCFYTPFESTPEYEHAQTGAGILDELFHTIKQRQQDRPEGSYTTTLFESGTARIAQKVGEEGVEVSLAAATKDTASLPGEVADLMYHTLVLLADAGLTPDDAWKVLRDRAS